MEDPFVNEAENDSSPDDKKDATLNKNNLLVLD